MKTDYFDMLENPFLIDIEDKEDYNYEDYINIQKKLKEKNLDTFLDFLYQKENLEMSLNNIKGRTTKGICQNIIDPSNNIVPKPQLFKLGDGGDGKNCFVCCTVLFDDRFNASKSIIKSFEELNYNGHFMLLNGGFPNPTGKEMKYIGVPYCFKIFMMLEANKLGFENIIWIDAACYAINNPESLFEVLKKEDAIFRAFNPNTFHTNLYNKIVFPKTIELLNNLCDRNVMNDVLVNSIVFGLNFCSPRIIEFVNLYYYMVNLGLPFLSEFPEEIVFNSIFNKPQYLDILENCKNKKHLYINEYNCDCQSAKKFGYFFLQRFYPYISENLES